MIEFKLSMFGNVPNYYCLCKTGTFCKEDHSGRYVREDDYAALMERHDKYKIALDVISRYRCEEFDHQEVAKAALAEEVDDE